MGEEEGFKVTDRRGHADASAGAEPRPSGSPPSDASRVRAGDSPADPRAGGPTPTELGHLLMMFASSALMSLGAVAEPGTGERRVDLGQAQAAIDVLLMLREKTQGNRSEDESRLLEDILYDLQMRFVRAARGPAQSGAP
jgi:hypothetical protein